MPKRKRKFDKKKLLTALAVLVVIGGTIFALEKTNTTDFIDKPGSNDTALTDGPTAEEKAREDAVNAENKQTLVEQEQAAAAETPSTATPTTPAATNQSIELSAKQESNNTVTVFTKLYNYSGGTCTLTVTNDGETATQTAPAMYQPEYASCAGFSVSTTELGSGTWDIRLKVVSNGATTTKNISYEVE